MVLDAAIQPATQVFVSGDCAAPKGVNDMEAEHFRAQLGGVGLSLRGFSYISGANPRTVQRWAEGKQDIPHWVGVMLRLIEIACPMTAPITQEKRLVMILQLLGGFRR